LAKELSLQRGSILVVRKEGSSVNRKIVEYSNKVLAPRIIRRYALSKGFAKGLQGVRNAYCNRLCGSLVVKVLALKGRIKLVVLGGLVLRVVVKVLAPI